MDDRGETLNIKGFANKIFSNVNIIIKLKREINLFGKIWWKSNNNYKRNEIIYLNTYKNIIIY